jgi:hypothetical protein
VAHPAQQKVIEESRLFNVLNCGRRFAKTALGIDRTIQTALRGLPTGWFSPIRRDDVRISGFVTENQSKARIVEALALAFEQGTIKISNDPVLVREL